MKGKAAGLRYELCARNASYAAESQLPHVLSSGHQAVVVYQSSDDRRHHGNFIDASYRAILKRSEWRRRLLKVHSHGNQSLPKSEWVWRELDSSMSSDALLMNIFCHPGVTKRREVSQLLGTEIGRDSAVRIHAARAAGQRFCREDGSGHEARRGALRGKTDRRRLSGPGRKNRAAVPGSERAAALYHYARGTVPKRLVWVPIKGGRWRIDWQRTNRG